VLQIEETQTAPPPRRVKTAKCVVWDLDNTIWRGTLLEDEKVSLRENITEIVKTLDRRGILQSIASKNDHAQAIARLREFGLAEYFLYPQIGWNAKSSAIKTIAESLNIGLDTFAFIDDEPFEREEVSFSLADVCCIDAADLDRLLDMPEMNPRFITSDSKLRRLLYINDQKRKDAEREFVGPQEDFLASLDMTLTISPAQQEDLQRAEELTVRTHQLNTTGYTYSYRELNEFRQSNHHKLLIADLEDKYGSYGKIGLALVECCADRAPQPAWIIRLLLMSCRVMARGAGTLMITHLLNLAKREGVLLQAEFVSTDRNRMMYVTYKLNGFKEIERQGNVSILEHDLERIPPYPEYVRVQIAD
jgi:FkbH-like protein